MLAFLVIVYTILLKGVVILSDPQVLRRLSLRGYHHSHSSLARELLSEGSDMGVIGEFARRSLRELLGLIDWAVGNWTITTAILVMLIYWAGRQKRLDRHHL
jgi:hypothetical protein